MTSSGSSDPAVYALLGDVVGSRRAGNRRVLHEHLGAALRQVEQVVPALEPLTTTVSDEFQGVYADVGSAVLASLLVRLHTLPQVDVRCGIGRGLVQVIDHGHVPPLQDGSAWWAARDAVEEAERRAASAGTRSCRTWYVEDPDRPSGAAATILATLVLRDELVSRLDARPLRVLLGVMSDLTQTMVAEQEGITQSAVSQLVARESLGAIREAHEILTRPARDR